MTTFTGTPERPSRTRTRHDSNHRLCDLATSASTAGAGPPDDYPCRVSPLRRYFAYPPGRVDYLTHISRRHRAVFVEVPKAGCTVVKRVLQHSERGDESYEEPESVHDRSTSPLGAPMRDGFDVDEIFAGDTYFRFAFVRNPYSRALSCYLEKIAGQQRLRDLRLPKLGFEPREQVGFTDFLRRVAEQRPREMDIHWAPQHHLLSLAKVSYGFLGRFESFADDLHAVIDRLGLNAPPQLLGQPTSHTTHASDKVRDYFDDESVGLVRQIYRRDFEALGYGRDPRFVR